MSTALNDRYRRLPVQPRWRPREPKHPDATGRCPRLFSRRNHRERAGRTHAPPRAGAPGCGVQRSHSIGAPRPTPCGRVGDREPPERVHGRRCDATGYRFNPVERFEPQGPTPSGLTKPDIVGPDGLTTTVYGPGRFYGTSASTPSVAGAVAVLMGADPTLSPRQALGSSLCTQSTKDRTGWPMAWMWDRERPGCPA